jgi:hypothetical protein
MNTTPLIFSTRDIPYTIVREKSYDNTRTSPHVTILLLNRHGKFHKEELLADLDACAFAETIYIEGPDISYEIDPLSKKFPRVKFILLKGDLSTGEKINLGVTESRSVFTFVLWSDMKLAHTSFTRDVMEDIGKKSHLCIVPLVENSKHELVPTIQVPGYMKRNVKVIPWQEIKDSCKSLFPFDYCGIYHKERFIGLGGFDPEITNPYWQKVDFGFRAFLWGEEIQLSKNIHIHYIGDVHSENVTPDESYKRFYLKNIYVKYKKGKGYLPYYKFFHYLFHSNTGPFTSWKEFHQVKEWVEMNSRHFKNNAQNLIAQWEVPEE